MMRPNSHPHPTDNVFMVEMLRLISTIDDSYSTCRIKTTMFNILSITFDLLWLSLPMSAVLLRWQYP